MHGCFRNIFICGYIASNIWLRTLGIIRGNPLPPLHVILLPINRKGYFKYTILQIAHTTTFVTPVVKH